MLPGDTNYTVDLGWETEDQLAGTWENGSGDSGRVVWNRLSAKGEADKIDKQFKTWSEFKEWADNYVGSGCAFRGQSHPGQLSSSFHRTGRVDLVRYIRRDLPVFVDYVDTLTGRPYDLQNVQDFGAVMGIAQHHGFPTPLVDWTMSPYVAAYFALARVIENQNPPEWVRVYRLSSKQVDADLSRPILQLIDANPTVMCFRPSSKGNSRLLNQQGLFTFTNITDMETVLRWLEDGESPKLEVIAIHTQEARRALADLRNMGTTPATLFPGIDGAAQYLKHQMFYS